MKIIDNRHKPNLIKFNDVGIGDCFEYNGDFYIKMNPIEHCDNVDYNYTVFKLDSCRAWWFACDTLVTKVNMKVIIRNE